MKTNFCTLCSLTTILLLGLTTLVFAQTTPTPTTDTQEAQRKAREMQRVQRAMMRSPAVLQSQKNATKQTMNSFWNGESSNLMAMGLLQQEDFREGLGVSKEQHQKIQDVMKNSFTDMQNDPSVKPMRDELTKLMTENGGPFAENASEETQKKFFELQSQMQLKTQEMMMQKMRNAVTENLTPDQLKKIKEFQISTMSEIPILSPSMFEALDLSDVQKQQLDGIKNEMRPEFEKQTDKMIDMQSKFMVKFQDELEKLESVTDPEERQRLMKNIGETVRKSNPEIQREMDEMMESGKVFANKMKTRMLDVLTDEQIAKMVQLIDNPPHYVKSVIAKIRKEMGQGDNETDEWRPGIHSWKPGDAIPAEYLKQREERKAFPTKED